MTTCAACSSKPSRLLRQVSRTTLRRAHWLWRPTWMLNVEDRPTNGLKGTKWPREHIGADTGALNREVTGFTGPWVRTRWNRVGLGSPAMVAGGHYCWRPQPQTVLLFCLSQGDEALIAIVCPQQEAQSLQTVHFFCPA